MVAFVCLSIVFDSSILSVCLYFLKGLFVFFALNFFSGHSILYYELSGHNVSG